ncbi:hypothetical protein ACO1KF_11585 [Leptospira interrogans serovar Hardjo-prajitno]|nr:hypothetical protein [Leptospira interrogans]UQX05896.1 hypothetical protein MY415_11405 [Leptospira interrogans]
MRKQLRLRTVFQTKAVSLLEMPILREAFSEFPGFQSFGSFDKSRSTTN